METEHHEIMGITVSPLCLILQLPEAAHSWMPSAHQWLISSAASWPYILSLPSIPGISYLKIQLSQTGKRKSQMQTRIEYPSHRLSGKPNLTYSKLGQMTPEREAYNGSPEGKRHSEDRPQREQETTQPSVKNRWKAWHWGRLKKLKSRSFNRCANGTDRCQTQHAGEQSSKIL